MNIETFSALIALDPARRTRFVADPEAELAAAGLSPAELRGLIPILERLAKALSTTDFPTPPNDPPIGG